MFQKCNCNCNFMDTLYTQQKDQASLYEFEKWSDISHECIECIYNKKKILNIYIRYFVLRYLLIEVFVKESIPISDSSVISVNLFDTILIFINKYESDLKQFFNKDIFSQLNELIDNETNYRLTCLECRMTNVHSCEHKKKTDFLLKSTNYFDYVHVVEIGIDSYTSCVYDKPFILNRKQGTNTNDMKVTYHQKIKMSKNSHDIYYINFNINYISRNITVVDYISTEHISREIEFIILKKDATQFISLGTLKLLCKRDKKLHPALNKKEHECQWSVIFQTSVPMNKKYERELININEDFKTLLNGTYELFATHPNDSEININHYYLQYIYDSIFKLKIGLFFRLLTKHNDSYHSKFPEIQPYHSTTYNVGDYVLNVKSVKRPSAISEKKH